MSTKFKFRLEALMVSFGLALTVAIPAAQAAGYAPVYVHTNGANDFLESLVAVHPGQKVVFVNEDTEAHTVWGYNSVTGKSNPMIYGTVVGTRGLGHPVSTYTVDIKKPGLYTYYCSVHAHLTHVYHGMVASVPNKGIHGYGGVMMGAIVVSRDSALEASNPPTSHFKVLKDYFGG